MTHRLNLAVGLALSVTLEGLGNFVVPPACQLLTTQEASTMMGGMPLTVDPQDAASGGFHCAYHRDPSASSKVSDLGAAVTGVEITYRTFPSAQSAHASFPRWVVPFPPTPADEGIHAVPGVGDTAVIVSNRAGKGIYFQRGAVLVKMGTHPAGVALDDALATAAKTMIGRM
jgi:hypothetical protein